MKISRQFAALPYVIIKGQVHLLLITRRRSGRWGIPKGWPEDGLQGPELAALEAFEEAGVKGRIRKKSIGSFRYVKQGKLTFDVEVFPLKVKLQYLDCAGKRPARPMLAETQKSRRAHRRRRSGKIDHLFSPRQKGEKDPEKKPKKEQKKDLQKNRQKSCQKKNQNQDPKSDPLVKVRNLQSPMSASSPLRPARLSNAPRDRRSWPGPIPVRPISPLSACWRLKPP